MTIRCVPAVSILLLAATGCASNQLQPTIVSSGDATGYAVQYPEALAAETSAFAAHKKKAHELSSSISTHTRDWKPSDDRPLLSRIVDYADVDGKREDYAGAARSDRSLRTFWDDERGPISARVAAATQKQVTEAKCTVADTQPSVQQALHAGVDRQLERRMRAHSEAQRVLDKYKARLSANQYAAMQKLVDDIALNSYLVNVALVEDVNALNHHVSEASSVDSTLQRALDEEHGLASIAQRGPEQKAAQERVQQINASRAALSVSRDKAQRELTDYQAQLQLARDEYVHALEALKASLDTNATNKAAPQAPPRAAAQPTVRASRHSIARLQPPTRQAAPVRPEVATPCNQRQPLRPDRVAAPGPAESSAASTMAAAGEHL